MNWKDKIVTLKDSPNSKLRVMGENTNGSLRLKFMGDYKPYSNGDQVIAMPYDVKEYGQKYSVTTFDDLNSLPEAEERRRGELIAEQLNLKQMPYPNEGRYYTLGGTKTALGLYRTLKRYIVDGE